MAVLRYIEFLTRFTLTFHTLSGEDFCASGTAFLAHQNVRHSQIKRPGNLTSHLSPRRSHRASSPLLRSPPPLSRG